MFTPNEGKSHNESSSTFSFKPVRTELAQIFREAITGELSVIHLENIELGKRGLDSLLFLLNEAKNHIDDPYTNLTHIYLTNTKIGADCLGSLHDILVICSECVYLELSYNNFGNDGLKTIIDIALKTNINYLGLKQIGACNFDPKSFAPFLKQDSIKLGTIELGENNFSESQTMMLLEIMAKSTVRLLFSGLSFNQSYLQAIFNQNKRKAFFIEGGGQKKLRADTNEIMADDLVITSFKLITPSRLEAIGSELTANFEEYNDQSKYNGDSSDTRLRNDGRKFSFSHNFPRKIFDSRFLKYPINQFADGYFLCEGPANNKVSVSGFLNELCANKYLKDVDTLLVIGDFNQGEGYYDYFSTNETFNTLRIVSEECAQEFPRVRKFELEIRNSVSQLKKITLFHLSCRTTSKSMTLGNDDQRFLYDLCLNKKPESLLVHCDTGLIFSPAILLSFHLFRNFTTLFSGTTSTVVQKVSNVINECRKSINTLLFMHKEIIISSLELAYSYMQQYCIALSKKDTPKIHKSELIKRVCLVGSIHPDEKSYLHIKESLTNLGIDMSSINLDLNKRSSEISQAINISESTSKLVLQELIVTSVVTKLRILNSNNKLNGVILLSKNIEEDMLINILKEIPKHIFKVYISSNPEKYSKYMQNLSVMFLNYPTKDFYNGNNGEEDVINNAISSIYGNLAYPFAVKNTVTPVEKNKSIVISAPLWCYNINLLNSLTKYWNTFTESVRKFLSTESSTQKEISYLIDQDEVQCVIEFPTPEIINPVQGTCQIKNYSLEKTSKNCRYVIIPGGIDILNVNTHFYTKKTISLKDGNYLLVTSKEEFAVMGKQIAERANSLAEFHKVDIVIPKLSLSNYSEYDTSLSIALYESIKTHLTNESINLTLIDAHINDEKCFGTIIELVKKNTLDSNFSARM